MQESKVTQDCASQKIRVSVGPFEEPHIRWPSSFQVVVWFLELQALDLIIRAQRASQVLSALGTQTEQLCLNPPFIAALCSILNVCADAS